jgi:hypothetical protein
MIAQKYTLIHYKYNVYPKSMRIIMYYNVFIHKFLIKVTLFRNDSPYFARKTPSTSYHVGLDMPILLLDEL